MKFPSSKILSASLALVVFISLPILGHGAVKKKAGSADTTNKVLQSSGQAQAPEGTPTREIQDIEVKMEEFDTSKNLTGAQRNKNARIKRDILTGTFDLRELSRLALARHWNAISAGEQSSFVNLMTNLLETKAIFSKEQSKTMGKAYNISYLGDKYYENKARAKTLTKIYVSKEDVTLDIEYRLKRGSSGWKVFDIIVDDASLVDNYKYQFNSIISKHGYSELVRRMRKKLAELKSN